jgi:hypothetical protein
MWTICTNIIGFPYEKKESLEDTLAFALNCGTDFATFYMLQPHIVSEVYGHFRKEGILDFDSILNAEVIDMDEFERMNRITSDGASRTMFFSADELKEFQKHAYHSFVKHRALSYALNPFLILRKIRSFEELRYALRLLKRGLGIFFRTFRKISTKKLLYPTLADE